MDSAPDGVYNKGMRPKNVRYPGGRLVHYRYGPEGSRDEMISRLATIHDDSDGLPGEVLSEYAYSGLGRMASERYPTPDVRLDYYQGTSPAAGQPSTASRQGYAGLDRYGRVKDQRWRFEGQTPADLDRYTYGYDYGSNRLWRKNMLTHGTANKFDEFYTYDGLSRLSNADRGTLDDPPWSGILTQVFRQKWGLDQMGNWTTFQEDDSDSGATWSLNQERTHNPANEITNITETTGPEWVTPTYDARGNMVYAPRPGDEATEAEALLVVYDAWNRPVEFWEDTNEDGDLDDPGDTQLLECRYDGTGRRILKVVKGAPDVSYDFYYNASWQILEVRRSDYEHAPYEQYVWSARYIDAPVLRDRDTDDDGDLDERLYYTADANMNVTALVDPDGDVVERYAYDPYGKVTVLNPDWSADEDGLSDFDNAILYCGYYLDWETGLYDVRQRYYHPTVGRMVSCDLIAYGDGMNKFQYAISNPIAFGDPSGLWHTVKGPPAHFCADHGDTLQGLLHELYTGSGNLGVPGTPYITVDDWMCLWPVKLAPGSSYPVSAQSKVSAGDIYDASNVIGILLGDNPFLYLTMDDPRTPLGAAYRASRVGYGVMGVYTGDEVYYAIKNRSGEGATPIWRFEFNAHSNGSVFMGPGDATIAMRRDTSAWKLKVPRTGADIKPNEPAPSYERARNKHGPHRCWFHRRAEGAFLGCMGETFSKAFAAAFLRYGSVIYTTDDNTELWVNDAPTKTSGVYHVFGGSPLQYEYRLSPKDALKAGTIFSTSTLDEIKSKLNPIWGTN